MNPRSVGYVAAPLLAALLSACDQKPSWHDESVASDKYRKERIEQFKVQGMDEVTAKQRFEYEQAWRNTDNLGRPQDDVRSGADLQNALNAQRE